MPLPPPPCQQEKNSAESEQKSVELAKSRESGCVQGLVGTVKGSVWASICDYQSPRPRSKWTEGLGEGLLSQAYLDEQTKSRFEVYSINVPGTRDSPHARK